MPRCVRNFWIDLDVDGRRSSIGTGPRSGGGGFKQTIRIRENKDISDKKIQIEGYTISSPQNLSNGKTGSKVINCLRIWADGEIVYNIQLDRD